MGEQMPIKWLKFEKCVAKLVEDGTYFASLDQVCYFWNYIVTLKVLAVNRHNSSIFVILNVQ